MEIIFLVDLPFNLAIHRQSYHKWIALTNDSRRIDVDSRKGVFQMGHSFTSIFLLLLDGILEITRERLDFLDLAPKISPQTAQLCNHIALNIPRLVRFDDGLLVVVTENPVRFVDAAIGEKNRRSVRVVNDV